MIQLRSNQVEPIEKAISFFQEKKPKPSLIVLPTAWGKSILTAFVAKNTNDKMIVLQPSKELLEQNYLKYVNLCDGFANAGIYSASFGSKEIAQITYATIGSIKTLGAKFKALGFTKMLIDEAHLFPREADSMLGTFLKESGITHVLGITATPVKLQTGRDQFGQNYSKLVMLTSRSEYTEDSVQRAFEENGGTQTIVNALDAHPERQHILAFAPSVQDAISLSERYPNSAVIYGDMDKRERASIIERFRKGEIRVIFNVRVLSTGFDYTGIDCIVLGVSTASIALYYQIIGRATRIDPQKKDALIVDLGGNVQRFGRVEDLTFEKGRMWRLFGSGGRLLSGIPIAEIGQYTREDTQVIDAQAAQPIQIMPFGKYKGEKISNIPLDYRKWMIRAFEWNSRNVKLKKSIMATL